MMQKRTFTKEILNQFHNIKVLPDLFGKTDPVKESKRKKLKLVLSYKKRKKKMLGSFIGKLDKDICILSLVVLSIITLTLISSNLFSLFNISGVFKQ